MKKIGIISSPGGHLVTLLNINSIKDHQNSFWITTNAVDTEYSLSRKKKYYAYWPDSRNIFNLFRNTFLAFKILLKERPDVLISSGAGIAIPFLLIGKCFFSTKIIFIEVFDFIKYPSLTGRIIYPFADYFIVQHSQQLKWYPKATYLGKIV